MHLSPNVCHWYDWCWAGDLNAPEQIKPNLYQIRESRFEGPAIAVFRMVYQLSPRVLPLITAAVANLLEDPLAVGCNTLTSVPDSILTVCVSRSKKVACSGYASIWSKRNDTGPCGFQWAHWGARPEKRHIFLPKLVPSTHDMTSMSRTSIGFVCAYTGSLWQKMSKITTIVKWIVWSRNCSE